MCVFQISFYHHPTITINIPTNSSPIAKPLFLITLSYQKDALLDVNEWLK